jgi:hypothetical protein
MMPLATCSCGNCRWFHKGPSPDKAYDTVFGDEDRETISMFAALWRGGGVAFAHTPIFSRPRTRGFIVLSSRVPSSQVHFRKYLGSHFPKHGKTKTREKAQMAGRDDIN